MNLRVEKDKLDHLAARINSLQKEYEGKTKTPHYYKRLSQLVGRAEGLYKRTSEIGSGSIIHVLGKIVIASGEEKSFQITFVNTDTVTALQLANHIVYKKIPTAKKLIITNTEEVRSKQLYLI